LSGALREEKTRLDAGFDPIAALNEEHPAPAWHPHVHNVEHRIRRFFASHCVAAAELLRLGSKHPLLQPRRGEDGRVIYCLGPRGGADEKLAKLAKRLSDKEKRLVLCIPAEEHDLKDLLLETKALRRLLDSPKLVDEEATCAGPWRGRCSRAPATCGTWPARSCPAPTRRSWRSCCRSCAPPSFIRGRRG
ncbi:MAG: hypothetical protein ISN26_05345, partial [Betaproteobacteria bacterium AqS2]|nr:hypothetical protein [Betaproteobacteria bacterium AqS2]